MRIRLKDLISIYEEKLVLIHGIISEDEIYLVLNDTHDSSILLLNDYLNHTCRKMKKGNYKLVDEETSSVFNTFSYGVANDMIFGNPCTYADDKLNEQMRVCRLIKNIVDYDSHKFVEINKDIPLMIYANKSCIKIINKKWDGFDIKNYNPLNTIIDKDAEMYQKWGWEYVEEFPEEFEIEIKLEEN